MMSNTTIDIDIDSEEIRRLIGSRMLQIRRQILRKNQTQMGAILGISVDRLSDYEQGRKITDPAIIYRLLLYLMSRGVDIRLLFLKNFDVLKIRHRKPKFNFNTNII